MFSFLVSLKWISRLACNCRNGATAIQGETNERMFLRLRSLAHMNSIRGAKIQRVCKASFSPLSESLSAAIKIAFSHIGQSRVAAGAKTLAEDNRGHGQ